jgi:hypothetical protein
MEQKCWDKKDVQVIHAQDNYVELFILMEIFEINALYNSRWILKFTFLSYYIHHGK